MHIKKERTCIACRKTFLQSEMLRIARMNNMYIIDEQQKLEGRGAYICKNKQCLNVAIKKKCLNRAFKSNLDNSIYVQLGEYEQNN